MKEVTKKFLIYYNEKMEMIGMREHHFDWEEGDTITTNGVSTTIFGIFEGTDKNMSLVRKMFETLRKYLPKKRWMHVLDSSFVQTGDVLEDLLSVMNHSHLELVNVRSQVWRDFDAQLDFVDEVMAQMEA